MDGGASRLRRIPRTNNTPGFPNGIAGLDLYARLRQQAEINGATLQGGVVSALAPCSDGFRLETTSVCEPRERCCWRRARHCVNRTSIIWTLGSRTDGFGIARFAMGLRPRDSASTS
jgi:hypothetical protein